MKAPKFLLLSLSITAALAACQKPAEPAAAAAKPAQAAAELPPLAGFNVADLDTSKNACVNLADFVNGKWLAANPVPSDRTSWGAFEMLDERSLGIRHQLAEEAALPLPADVGSRPSGQNGSRRERHRLADEHGEADDGGPDAEQQPA